MVATLLSGAVVAFHHDLQTAIRPAEGMIVCCLQITAVARRRIQILVATLQQRRFMMRAEMRDLFKVLSMICHVNCQVSNERAPGVFLRVLAQTHESSRQVWHSLGYAV